ncbi:hypothetical protein EON67_05605 [archaeon]|nr:MAG: hypothetical protein EON67_05605 [archaeon]
MRAGEKEPRTSAMCACTHYHNQRGGVCVPPGLYSLAHNVRPTASAAAAAAAAARWTRCATLRGNARTRSMRGGQSRCCAASG